MSKRALKIAALTLAALTALPALVEAGPRRAPRQAEDYQEQPAYNPRQANRCMPWCDRDTSPCDPANFKIADGRCAGVTPFITW